jgi:hypothetical protein
MRGVAGVTVLVVAATSMRGSTTMRRRCRSPCPTAMASGELSVTVLVSVPLAKGRCTRCRSPPWWCRAARCVKVQFRLALPAASVGAAAAGRPGRDGGGDRDRRRHVARHRRAGRRHVQDAGQRVADRFSVGIGAWLRGGRRGDGDAPELLAGGGRPRWARRPRRRPRSCRRPTTPCGPPYRRAAIAAAADVGGDQAGAGRWHSRSPVCPLPGGCGPWAGQQAQQRPAPSRPCRRGWLSVTWPVTAATVVLKAHRQRRARCQAAAGARARTSTRLLRAALRGSALSLTLQVQPGADVAECCRRRSRSGLAGSRPRAAVLPRRPNTPQRGCWRRRC